MSLSVHNLAMAEACGCGNMPAKESGCSDPLRRICNQGDKDNPHGNKDDNKDNPPEDKDNHSCKTAQNGTIPRGSVQSLSSADYSHPYPYR